MSTEPLENLRSQAFTLSNSDRAELARDLIRSLDAPSDRDAEQAWEREIAQRLSQVENDQAELLSREEFRKRLQEKMRGQ